jgi:hypothetical protein
MKYVRKKGNMPAREEIYLKEKKYKRKRSLM